MEVLLLERLTSKTRSLDLEQALKVHVNQISILLKIAHCLGEYFETYYVQMTLDQDNAVVSELLQTLLTSCSVSFISYHRAQFLTLYL